MNDRDSNCGLKLMSLDRDSPLGMPPDYHLRYARPPTARSGAVPISFATISVNDCRAPPMAPLQVDLMTHNSAAESNGRATVNRLPTRAEAEDQGH
jgi:hypothetical protein